MSAAANPVLTITEAPPLSKTAAKAIERAEKAVARAAAKAAKAALPKRPRGRPRKGTAPAPAPLLPPSGTGSVSDGSTIMDNMSAHSSVHFDADSDSEVAILRAELSELKARHAALELAYQKAANTLDAIRKVLTLSSL
jgi:hypothetical protein